MENKVEFLGSYGGDKEHAMSAWTSTSRDYEGKKERMPALLKMLAEAGHHTPFEKSSLHFLVTTDIATHIHLLKHRISNLNAESARYKELKEDKEYLPKDWEGIKCSHFEYNGKDLTGAHWTQILKQHQKWSNALYHKAIEDLEGSLGRKRAKESARYFKLYSSQITADVMFNFRSFMHFQKLRNSNHSQVEIHNVAEQMLDLVKRIEGNPFKESLKGFGYE